MLGVLIPPPYVLRIRIAFPFLYEGTKIASVCVCVCAWLNRKEKGGLDIFSLSDGEGESWI